MFGEILTALTREPETTPVAPPFSRHEMVTGPKLAGRASVMLSALVDAKGRLTDPAPVIEALA